MNGSISYDSGVEETTGIQSSGSLVHCREFLQVGSRQNTKMLCDGT
jgi:hypothetical protein